MLRQCRILVIDDDPNLGRTLALMLEHVGHTVTTADALQQGLCCVEIGDYDLVLFDIAAFDPEDHELLSRLNERCPSVPMLVLIGQDQSGLDADLRKSGATLVLYKPVDAEILLARVTALLDSKCQPYP